MSTLPDKSVVVTTRPSRQTWTACGTTSGPMPEVTPRQLYDRLVEVTDARSDEDLARRLDEGLRTIQRLKAGNGVEFDRAIYLLGQAGWLRLEGAQPNIERARLLATQIADRLEDLAAALGAP